jgi:ornithine cyclodeaminase/alanine dehydrogenase-like protein (mu-crystallin family)
MGDKTGLTIEPEDSLDERVRQSGITVSATTAMAPLIKMVNVQPGATHILLGGWADEKSYVVACAQPPNKIVCDDIETVLHLNVQTVAYAYHEGLICREDFQENLGESCLETSPSVKGMS